MIRKSLFLSFIVAGIGCGNEPTVCTAMSEFAISVRVRDAATGQPAAFGATLVARDGSYADSTSGTYSGSVEPAASILSVAEERTGTYDVAVSKAGYQPWSRQRVTVGTGACGVEGVTLNALLQKT